MRRDDGIEPRGLDQDVAGLLRDHGVEAAHHAGEGDGLYGVGDDQVFRRKCTYHSIERLERLAAEGAAHQNLAAFEQVEIEDVGGMPHLPEGVVGGVGGVVDGALIDESKSLGNIVWRSLDGDAANDASGVTGASDLVTDLN